MADGAKDMMGTNKRIIRARGHEFLAEDEGNRTRISIKIDGAWEHATTVNSDNQTAAEWIEANAKPGDPSRWLPSAFSRPGEKDTMAVEDRFYFGKGRKERFADDYAAANRRVQASSELRKYARIIMSDDWREGADHWNWVATAPVSEIVGWAKEIADNL